ncbi:MAG TPA: hypothetical protein DDW53_02085 [Lachnoclostridium sp.]|nr:hypothetical protein [Lachnoclostridium sp.]
MLFFFYLFFYLFFFLNLFFFFYHFLYYSLISFPDKPKKRLFRDPESFFYSTDNQPSKISFKTDQPKNRKKCSHFF